jgi:hypothetical protein
VNYVREPNITFTNYLIQERKIFHYVGKGSGNRATKHLGENEKTKENRRKYSKILKIRDAYDLEENLIKFRIISLNLLSEDWQTS